MEQSKTGYGKQLVSLSLRSVHFEMNFLFGIASVKRGSLQQKILVTPEIREITGNIKLVHSPWRQA